MTSIQSDYWLSLVPTLRVGMPPGRSASLKTVAGRSHAERGNEMAKNVSGLHSHAERGNEIRCVTPTLKKLKIYDINSK